VPLRREAWQVNIARRHPTREACRDDFIESLNDKLHDVCLNTNQFLSVADAKRKIEAWRTDTAIADRIALWETGTRLSIWMGQRTRRLRCGFPAMIGPKSGSISVNLGL
jgi:hypothetical protein